MGLSIGTNCSNNNNKNKKEMGEEKEEEEVRKGNKRESKVRKRSMLQ